MQTPQASRMYAEPTNPVRVVLLADSRGRGEVVVPVSHLLDLTRAGKLTQIQSAPVFFLLPTIPDKAVAAYTHCQYDIITVDGAERQKVALSTLRESSCRVRAIRCTVPAEALYRRVPAASNDLDQIFNSIRNFTTLRIKQRLEETLEIPPLTQTAQRIITLRSNPDATVAELAEIVESDASLAAQVVSWASSPYYAAPSKIKSVQDAILRVLGFDLVSNLALGMALGMALGNTLAMPKDCPDGFTPYWQQSVFCSNAVEAIVKLIAPAQRPSLGLACLAGLLHNFGYLVLAHTFPPHFSSICRHVEANPHISHAAIDHHLLGVTREQISAWLMQLWNMPPEVSVALRFQNEPEYEGEHCAYPHLIFIAMRHLRHHGIGDAPPEEIPLTLYQRYGLDPVKVAAAIDKVLAAAEDIRKMADNFQ